jgi:hypothetical protein
MVFYLFNWIYYSLSFSRLLLLFQLFEIYFEKSQSSIWASAEKMRSILIDTEILHETIVILKSLNCNYLEQVWVNILESLVD